MSKTFSVSEYVKMLGEELVAAFEQGSLAPTPGTVGESREGQYARNSGSCFHKE